ncbi:MAG: MFS transporter [Planctomycetota bacterium]
MTAAPLSRSQERLAVLALAFGVFVVAVNVNLVGALVPYLREDGMYRGMSGLEGHFGLLLGAANGASALAALLLGPSIDRYGRRGPMLLGGVLLVAGIVAHLFAVSPGQLLLVRGVSGFGGGLVFASASAAVADLVPYERRAAAMGIFSAGLFLATPVGLPLGLAIAERAPEGWRTAFGWLALPSLLAVVGFARFLPAGLGRAEGRVNQWQVLRQPGVFPALLSVALYTGGFFTAVQFAPDWLDRSGLMPKEDQKLLWIFLGLSTAVGSLILPRFADRLGKRPVVLFATAGVAICFLLLARATSTMGLLAVGLPVTMLAALRSPALQALMSDIVEARHRGTLMGLRAAAVNVGGSLCAFGGGKVVEVHGYRALLYAGALILVASYFLVRYFVKERS